MWIARSEPIRSCPRSGREVPRIPDAPQLPHRSRWSDPSSLRGHRRRQPRRRRDSRSRGCSDRVLGRRSAYDTQQSSLGCGDDHHQDVVLFHAAEQLVEGFIGAHSCGTGLHHSLDGEVGRSCKLFRTQPAENDPVFVDDHTPVGISAGGHVADQVIGSAGHGADQRIQCSGRCWFAAHRGLTGGEPVGLAEGVVVGLEPESFEPPRGPRRYVSKPIPAVHDDRAGAIKDAGRLGGQRLDRQMDRAG